MILGALKFVLFVICMTVFLVHHTLISIFVRNEKHRLKYFLGSISVTSRIALRILNVKTERLGSRGEVRKRLIVANHLSYLDVLVLFAHYPSLFITSVEIKETFLLGRICKLAGCFFVERRRDKRSIETKNIELADMRRKFDAGHNIFLFPEGTSSDGSSVLPFKGTFFQLAIDTETPVKPLCLKYVGKNKDVPPWYGDMTFPDHLFRLCLEKEINVKVIELDDIRAAEKMVFAKVTHELISETYAKH